MKRLLSLFILVRKWIPLWHQVRRGQHGRVLGRHRILLILLLRQHRVYERHTSLLSRLVNSGRLWVKGGSHLGGELVLHIWRLSRKRLGRQVHPRLGLPRNMEHLVWLSVC